MRVEFLRAAVLGVLLAASSGVLALTKAGKTSGGDDDASSEFNPDDAQLKPIKERVVGYAVDCGSEGYEGAIADKCVHDKIRDHNERSKSSTTASNARLRAIEKNAELVRHAKFSREVRASARAHRRFKVHHPDAVARLQRQEKRKDRQKNTKPAEPKPEALRYKPFLEQPEFAPRFSPDLIHRDISSRSMRYVPHTGYAPHSQKEPPKHRGPYPNNLEIAASMKAMKTAVAREEKKMQLQDKQTKNRMTYELDKEIRVLAGKPARPVALSNADRTLIRAQVKTVMSHVNPIADQAIQEVTGLDAPVALPSGPAQTLTVTANDIARRVASKVVNSTTQAIKIMRIAQKSAKEIRHGASLMENATLEAQAITAQANAEANRIQIELTNTNQLVNNSSVKHTPKLSSGNLSTTPGLGLLPQSDYAELSSESTEHATGLASHD